MNCRIFILSIAALLLLTLIPEALAGTERDNLFKYYQDYLVLVQSPGYPKMVQQNRSELLGKMDQIAQKYGFANSLQAETLGEKLGEENDVAVMRSTLNEAIDKQLGGRRE